MSAEPRDRPTSAELGIALTALGQRLGEDFDKGSPAPAASSVVASPVSIRRLLLTLGGASGVLLAAFTMFAPGQRAADTYAPKDVAVSPGPAKGELIVSWSMPIRPDVVATVIYEGTRAAKARAIVNYDTSPSAVPGATVRGLPSGQEVCLSAAHVVSLGGSVTNALGRPACAVPR